jgi:iron complex outermembrane receptor protein
LDYAYHKQGLTASVSPYLAHYQNYIYLQPSGNWSELPHAGQVYKYTGAKTFVAGAEASLTVDLTSVLHYQLEADYVFMWNMDEHTPLSFSPPARVKNQVAWGKEGKGKVFVEGEWIAKQGRVAKNEETTPGAWLGSVGAMVKIKHGTVQITVNNVLNTKYYNHLSFYRKINVPEMGRNIQVLFKLPINILLK